MLHLCRTEETERVNADRMIIILFKMKHALAKMNQGRTERILRGKRAAGDSKHSERWQDPERLEVHRHPAAVAQISRRVLARLTHTAGLKKQSKHTPADPRRAESLTHTSLRSHYAPAGARLHAGIGRDDCVRFGTRANIAQHQLNKRDLWELGLPAGVLLQMDVNLLTSNQRMIYLGRADRERVTGNSWALINIR